MSGRIGWRQASGCLTACAWWHPPHGLPASALFKPCVEQQKPACRHDPEQDEHDHNDWYGQRRPVWYRRQGGHQARVREGRTGKRHDGYLLLIRRSPGGLRRPGSGQPGGGEVSSEGGQIGVGPRRERPADPQVEFVLVQPFLHERGLEHLDHLLAVGVRRPQVAPAARACRYLVTWPRHPGTPHEHNAPKE